MSDQTTVMFADLMGSTGVFETIGSARASRVVTGLTQWIGDIVAAHRGRVVKTLGDGQTLNILEVFDKDATKWSAISWLAKEWDIRPAQIIAIGDEINDLSMIQGAGLGIAMGNAIPATKAAARRITLSNEESGVAHAIDRVLAGDW